MTKNIFSFFLFLFLLVTVGRTEQRFPFQVGEELQYKLKWGIFSVGRATLTVNEPAFVDGEWAHHFTFEVKTNSFADNFYKVRTRIDGYVSQDMTKSVLYKKRQQEGDTDRNITVTFNWNQNEVQYQNWDETLSPLSVTDNVFDPLSMLYAFRVMPLQEDSSMPMKATDGKKIVDSEINVVKKEDLKVPAGRYSCYLVEPDVKDLGGVFQKSDDATMQIWLEANENYHYPVKLKSKVRVGSFEALLTSAVLPQKQ